MAYGNPIERLNVNNDVVLTALYLQDVNTNALSGVVFTIYGYSQAPTLYLAFAGTQYTELTLRNSDVLTSYDVLENVQLTKLDVCNNPQVAEVNVSTLSELTYLNVGAKGAGGGSLASLNLENNIKLETLYCDNNVLTSLNVDNNVNLVTFNCSVNQLSTLRITNNTRLETVDASNNQLLNLNVRQNTALKSLNVGGNAGITALALGYNTAIETLNASNTGLTDIDLSANTALKDLNLSGCSSMYVIDLAVNTALTTLNLSGTSLTTLDVSSNTALTTLDVSNNTDLTTLDVSNEVMLKVSAGLKSSIYAIGQYISIENKTGVVFSIASPNVEVISTDETTLNHAEAVTWCRAKGTAWYLPRKEKLSAIYKNKAKLNTILSSIGGRQLGTGYYWSSTMDGGSGSYAYGVNFNSGSVSSIDVGSRYSVRAIRSL